MDSISPERVTEIQAARALYKADLPDSFTHSLYKLSPFRGCSHGCRYCDGRAEKYFVEGEFDRDIQVRKNLPLLLAAELPKIRERGLVSISSGTTDSYQGIERQYRIVRDCGHVLLESRLPVSIMTKSAFIQEDLPLWSQVAKKSGFLLVMSITTLDEHIRETFEPGASPMSERLETLIKFKRSGANIGVLAMPLLPGISDSESSIRQLYGTLQEIGVDYVMPGGLTLRPGRQKEIYLQSLASYDSSLSEHTKNMYLEERPSGAPSRGIYQKTLNLVSRIQTDAGIPWLLPHSVYRRFMPEHDALHLLLHDLSELYSARGVDTRRLGSATNRYDNWLLGLRRAFRRRRSFPDDYLESRMQEAFQDGEIDKILDNTKLANLCRRIHDGEEFNYVSRETE